MSFLAVIFVAQLLAQPSNAQAPSGQTYVITMSDDSVFNGMYKEEGNQITIYPDTPWKYSEPLNINRHRVKDIVPETTIRRQRRYQEQSKLDGYKKVTTAAGDSWQLIADIEAAEKARAAAAALEDKLHGKTVAQAAEAVAAEGPAPQPSLVKQWWMHVAVVLVGLALLGVVVKFLIMEGDWAQV